MVGQLQWLVTLGKFDLHAQVATMSRLRAAPRQEQWTELKGSTPMPVGLGIMQLGLELINLITLSYQIKVDWTYSVYGDVHKSFLMTYQNHLARL